MKLFDVWSFVGVMTCFLALSSAIGQKGGGNSALVSFADSLRAHGIEIPEPSLIAALRNADPVIRGLAALKLAEDHDLDSVPAIEDALSIEEVPDARIDIAGALWSLHDPKGLAHLQAMCSEPSLPTDNLWRLIQTLNGISESSAPCADAVLNFLDSHTDDESRSKFYSVLPEIYRWVSPLQAEHITRLLQSLLSAPDPTERLTASHGLVQIGSRSSAAALREAIAKETNSLVRTRMRNDLSILEKTQLR